MMVLVDIVFPVICLGLAVLIGGRPERWGAWIAIAGFLATWYFHETTWRSFEGKVFAVDVAVLIGFWTIAMRSDRFWPYWVTAWQLVGVFVHLQSVAFGETYVRPYAMLSLYLAVPIVGLIALSALQYRLNHTSRASDLPV